MRRTFLIILLVALCWQLTNAQTQTEVPYAKPCPYGYLEYIPKCLTVVVNCDTVKKCPKYLLISLHGLGKRGNGTTDLYKVAQEGVAKLIKDNQFNRYEFIVISPQLFTGQSMYSPKTLHIFVEQMIAKYRPEKTFMVGLSAGGNSIFTYIVNYRDVSAVIPIAGSGNYKVAWQATGIRLWSFHGQTDTVVKPSGDIQFIKNYNLSADSTGVEHARVTIYPNVGHSGWQETYTGKWKDIITEQVDKDIHHDSFNYDHYQEDIYDWLLK